MLLLLVARPSPFCTHTQSNIHTFKSSYDKNGTPKYYFSFTNSFAFQLELLRRARQQRTRYVSELGSIFVHSFHEFDAVRGVPYIVQSEKYCCKFGSPAKRLCVKYYSEFASYEIQANKMNKKSKLFRMKIFTWFSSVVYRI